MQAAERVDDWGHRIENIVFMRMRELAPLSIRQTLAEVLHVRPKLPLAEPYCLTVGRISGFFYIEKPEDLTTFAGKFNERQFMETFIRWVRSDQEGLVWDIGAAQGKYTVIAARLGLKVIAFEPHTGYQRRLQRNISLNGINEKVTVHRIALDDKEGTGYLHYGHACPSFINVRHCRESELVAVSSIDTLISQGVKPPNYMKIDTEGSELAILRGGQLLLASPVRPKHIFVEIHEDHLRAIGASGANVVALLSNSGYEVHDEESIQRGSTTLCHFMPVESRY